MLLVAECHLGRMAPGGLAGGHGIPGDTVAGVGVEIAAATPAGPPPQINTSE